MVEDQTFPVMTYITPKIILRKVFCIMLVRFIVSELWNAVQQYYVTLLIKRQYISTSSFIETLTYFSFISSFIFAYVLSHSSEILLFHDISSGIHIPRWITMFTLSISMFNVHSPSILSLVANFSFVLEKIIVNEVSFWVDWVQGSKVIHIFLLVFFWYSFCSIITPNYIKQLSNKRSLRGPPHQIIGWACFVVNFNVHLTFIHEIYTDSDNTAPYY